MSDLEDQTNIEFEKLDDKNPGLIRRTYDKSHDYINYKLGSLAGLFAGGIVFYINSSHGVFPASFASGKQFLYNLFVGGVGMKMCEKLAKKYENTAVALTASTIAPTVFSFFAAYSIHKIGGTPEAFNSSIVFAPLNAVTAIGFGIYYRTNITPKLMFNTAMNKMTDYFKNTPSNH